jgi:hypothetical protein
VSLLSPHGRIQGLRFKIKIWAQHEITATKAVVAQHSVAVRARKMDRAAVRLNNYAASLIVGLGGKYIKYPEISWDNQGMFANDGVHLSQLGNSFFSVQFAVNYV